MKKHVLKYMIRTGTIASMGAGLFLPSSIVNAATADAANVIQIYADANPEKRPTHIQITIGDGNMPTDNSTANTVHIALGNTPSTQPTIIKIYWGKPSETQTDKALSQQVIKSGQSAQTEPLPIQRVAASESVRPVRILDEKPVSVKPGNTPYKPVQSAKTSTVAAGNNDVKAADTVSRHESVKMNDAAAVVSKRMDIPTIEASQPVRPVSLDTMFMVDRLNQPAPKWTYAAFEALDKEGLLFPDQEMNWRDISRREGAILTARAYNRYYRHDAQPSTHTTDGTAAFSGSAVSYITQLMNEFAAEIDALGYAGMIDLANTKVQTNHDNDWQVHGEIRYSLANNEGSPTYTWMDQRLRARVYLQKQMNPHWTAYAMGEYDKSHISKDTIQSRGISRHRHDGDLRFSRFYVEGRYTWWDIPFTIAAGKTYAYLGDGNVLDSDFRGTKITAKPTVNTSLTAGAGKVNDTENMQFLEAWNRQKRWDSMLGWYHWNNYDNPTTIMALGGQYTVGNYRFGSLYLHSNIKDGSGSMDGYVLSSRFGQNFSWIPHTYEFDLNYYHMAGNTYINHTMNGLGNYMDGFTGWGALFYYTLYENLLFSLQYYDLQDKTTHEKSRTLWADLTWGF